MIKITGLQKSFRGIKLYDRFNINFDNGCITSIIGPSGCGKTTLLRIIAGLEPFERGKIEGVDQNRISFVFQEDRLLPWLSVLDNINLVIRDKGLPPSDKNRILQDVLKMLRLEEYKEIKPDELSGGMQRRVAIGRALAYDLAFNGQLVLMDEPFKGLDSKLKDDIKSHILEIWRKYKKTIILVTHDIEDAKQLSDTIYEFSGQPVTWRKLED